MISRYIYFLVVGSLIGWILEMIFKKIAGESNVSAGMSKGPFCILYGIGTLFLAVFISKYTDNIFITFLFSSICLTGFEYITGVLLDKVYGIELWDYSKLKYGINKHISLEFTFLWGILGVLFIKYILPILNKIYIFTYSPIQILVIYSVLLIIVIDYTYSSFRILSEKNIMET